jgi:hypothetical protein
MRSVKEVAVPVPNFTGLRAEALKQLKARRTPFSQEEIWLVASLIGQAIAEEVRAQGIEEDMEVHPLVRSMAFEVETLHMGKYEWLLCWLSPEHRAMQTIPHTMVTVAEHLLGMTAISARDKQEIRDKISRLV